MGSESHLIPFFLFRNLIGTSYFIDANVSDPDPSNFTLIVEHSGNASALNESLVVTEAEGEGISDAIIAVICVVSIFLALVINVLSVYLFHRLRGHSYDVQKAQAVLESFEVLQQLQQ